MMPLWVETFFPWVCMWGLYVGTLGRALNPQNVISWGHMARKSPNMVLGQQPGAGTPESMWGGWLGGL